MRSTFFIAAALIGTPAIANDPPPRHLYDTGGIVCVMAGENGTVADAFMAASTGSRRIDADFLTYARQMRLSGPKHGGEERGAWFSMAFMSKIPKTPPVKPDCHALAARR